MAFSKPPYCAILIDQEALIGEEQSRSNNTARLPGTRFECCKLGYYLAGSQRVPDVHGFRAFLRDLDSHPRKNLRGALVSFPGAVHDKASVDAKLAALAIDGNTRAETLSVEDHLRLAAAFAG